MFESILRILCLHEGSLTVTTKTHLQIEASCGTATMDSVLKSNQNLSAVEISFIRINILYCKNVTDSTLELKSLIGIRTAAKMMPPPLTKII